MTVKENEWEIGTLRDRLAALGSVDDLIEWLEDLQSRVEKLEKGERVK